MAYTNEQLHPNWRALATIHLPLKRFIREGIEDAEQGRRITRHQCSTLGVSGEEAQQFYGEIVKNGNSETNIHTPKRTLEKACSSRSQQLLLPFDKNKYFRYAMENRAVELQKFNFGVNDLNARDMFGWTGLMMASCEGAESAVRVLLDLGVDKEAKNSTGHTAMDLAKRKGHWHIVNLLETPTNSTPLVTHCDDSGDKLQIVEPFYCATCKRTFTETTQRSHRTSTVHQFNMKSSLPVNKLQKFNIPSRNRGLKLMVKQGWNKESGLGPTQTGRLYPVKTVMRQQRTGLGIEQPPARVTHFEAYDLRAIQRHSSDYYHKKPLNRNDMCKEKQREWKRERRLRNELS